MAIYFNDFNNIAFLICTKRLRIRVSFLTDIQSGVDGSYTGGIGLFSLQNEVHTDPALAGIPPTANLGQKFDGFALFEGVDLLKGRCRAAADIQLISLHSAGDGISSFCAFNVEVLGADPTAFNPDPFVQNLVVCVAFTLFDILDLVVFRSVSDLSRCLWL